MLLRFWYGCKSSLSLPGIDIECSSRSRLGSLGHVSKRLTDMPIIRVAAIPTTPTPCQAGEASSPRSTRVENIWGSNAIDPTMKDSSAYSATPSSRPVTESPLNPAYHHCRLFDNKFLIYAPLLSQVEKSLVSNTYFWPL